MSDDSRGNTDLTPTVRVTITLRDERLDEPISVNYAASEFELEVSEMSPVRSALEQYSHQVADVWQEEFDKPEASDE